MLSSCADHSLRIWDLNTTRCLALFAGHTGLVVSLLCVNLVFRSVPKRNYNRVKFMGPDCLFVGHQRSTKVRSISPVQVNKRDRLIISKFKIQSLCHLNLLFFLHRQLTQTAFDKHRSHNPRSDQCYVCYSRRDLKSLDLLRTDPADRTKW